MEHIDKNEKGDEIADNDANNDDTPHPAQQQCCNVNNASGQSNQQLLLTIVANQGDLQWAMNEHTTGVENACVALSHQEKTLGMVMRKIDMNPLWMLQRANDRRGAVA